MAAKEMYDYLADAIPDVEETLSVNPQEVIWEDGEKPGVTINVADDLSEERIIHSDKSIFHIRLIWKALSQSDAGTIFDFYHSTSKGCGMAKSFWWTPPAAFDGHTYVVRFAGPISRFYQNYLIYGFGAVTLKMLGRKPD